MDTLALALLICSTAASLFAVPDFRWEDLIEPTMQAAIATPLVLTALLVMRVHGVRPTRERQLMALFLGLMPTVYLLSGYLHGISWLWMLIELIGQGIFAAIAVAGVRQSPWILVAGLAAHGLVWDAFHYERTTFMPSWYAVACLIVDVGWAGYAALRVPAWVADTENARQAAAAPGRVLAGAVSTAH